MTKQEAIAELTRAADLCPTTPLAEACRMAVEAIMYEAVKKRAAHDCVNCRHADRMPGVYPCNECEERYTDAPSKWESKGVDNGKTD